MDGTLTNAIHDFDDIRAQLGLPAGIPILESIAQMPIEQANKTHAALDKMEYDIADEATAQEGSEQLLQLLTAQGFQVGIVTRNGHGIAKATLKACGLDGFFNDQTIISRDCCEPKPHPAGVELLLSRWGANAETAVMVGDYLFDLEAGKQAGVATIHLDVKGQFPWPEQTDYGITSLDVLCALFYGEQS